MNNVCCRITLIFLLLLPLIGCGGKEKSDQGRVIAFDKNKGTITLIRDIKANVKDPDYSHLPPISYTLVKEFLEKEPELRAGLRMKLDTGKNRIILYDPISQNFETVVYRVLDKKENIAIENPLVFDTDKKKPREFPIINLEKKMITIYSRRQRILVTFTLPEKYFNLPEYTWDAGDEVRVFYKEEGKALRFLNITRMGFNKD